jgi:hypothetical protein
MRIIFLHRQDGKTAESYARKLQAHSPKAFASKTIFSRPEFQEISRTLRTYLSEVTERVISEVICRDNSEAAIVDEPRQLPETADSVCLE